MSLRFFILMTLWIPNAFAAIQVGDTATVQNVLTLPGQESYSTSITSLVTALDPANDKVSYQENLSDSLGNSHTNNYKVATNYLHDGRSMRDPRYLASLCAAEPDFHGVIETITVPAGTFQACKWTYELSSTQTLEMWNGAVPFGLLKSVYKDSESGEVDIGVLQNFSFSK